MFKMASVVTLLFLSLASLSAAPAVSKPHVAEPITYTLGAPLGRPHNMDVDEYGRIYVVDHGRHATMRFEVDGRLDKTWVDEWHQVQFPAARSGLAVVPGGTVLIGPGAWEQNILKIGPNPGDEVKIPLSGEPGYFALWALPDGTYATLSPTSNKEDRSERQVVVYSPDGTVKTTFMLSGVGAITLGPDGVFYAIEESKPLIRTYGLDGKLLDRKIDVSAAFPYGGFFMASQLNIDINGDIYLGTKRFDSNGKLLNEWTYQNASIGKDGNLIEHVQCTAVRNGLVYVMVSTYKEVAVPGADPNTLGTTQQYVSSRVDVYTPDGQCVAQYLSKQNGLNMPSSIAVQLDGSYAVAEHGSGAVTVFDASGRRLNQQRPGSYVQCVTAKPGGGYYSAGYHDSIIIASDGSLKSHIHKSDPYKAHDNEDNPVQMAIDLRTRHLWAMSWAGVLQEYDADGKLIRSFPANPKLNTNDWSTAMAIDSKGFIYLPDSKGQKIIKADQEGNFITSWGTKGTGIGEMRYPEGIAIDRQDRIYICDSENSRIQVFTTDGKPLGVWGKFGDGVGELNRPFALAIGPQNTLWISDTFNDRIVKISLVDFWKQIKTKIDPEQIEIVIPEPWPVESPKTTDAGTPTPTPAPVELSITGVVTAGTDDLTDVIYVESPERLWGTKVTVPKGKFALRGHKVKVTGTIESKAHAAKHVKASKIDIIAAAQPIPKPFGMSNHHVGDGYGQDSKSPQLSNLGLLIKSWGRVVSVDKDKKLIIINDGSYPKGKGLVVYAGDLVRRLVEWPAVDQYICVTGISITWNDNENLTPGLRIRDSEDIKVLDKK